MSIICILATMILSLTAIYCFSTKRNTLGIYSIALSIAYLVMAIIIEKGTNL